VRLELGALPVREVVLGTATRYRDAVLEVDPDELLAIARRDPRVTGVRLDLARPGESVRVVNVQDVIEPRLKVEGPGVAYPGVAGRPTDTVGRGRTLRLAGVGVVMCADLLPYRSAPFTIFRSSFDMAGPGAVEPYGQLCNLCLTFDTEQSADYPERNHAAWDATFAVAERLAQTMAGLTPATIETYAVEPPARRLPRVALVANVHSVEHHAGTVFGFGESVYGLTRLHPPWALRPTEILDGCIARRNSWLNANDPLVQDMIGAHGRDFDFVGVIVQRTRWSYQPEKDLTAQQTAKLARMLGAEGVLISSDAGGNDFVEVALTVRACMEAGLETVFMSTEESSEDGAKPPWLFPIPEADAVVSLGSGRGVFGRAERAGRPPVERAIGGPVLYTDGDALDGAPIPATGPAPGRGAGAYSNRWGTGRLSCFDY
jgi:sarcosine reductase